MNFLDAVNQEINEAPAFTENGMLARATTANAVLDFFSKAGSSRGVDLTREFMAALAADEDLAVRALLWTRDVRGGAGERAQFRNLIQKLEEVNPLLASRLIPLIPELGRWDDLFSFQNATLYDTAMQFYANAIRVGNGLAAKWAPRKGKDAIAFRNALGMSPKAYRKTIVALTQVVETQMCAKDWNNIDFNKVPSLAAARYQKAFIRNASEKYGAYRNALVSGSPEAKINAGAVYPYDIVKSVRRGDRAVADAQWKSLPNFIGSSSILPIVDVSGSMGVRVAGDTSALDIAVSLGLYVSEKNRSEIFRDVFLTFSNTPKFVSLKGTLSQRMQQMETSEWQMNTNIEAAMMKILQVAVRGSVQQSDMPQVLLILSDMQFDCCVSMGNVRAMKMIERKFTDAGYNIPRVVFWNLNGGYGRDNTPVRFDEFGTALISGFSPAIMKTVLSNDLENFTPMSVMLKTLLNPRYNY